MDIFLNNLISSLDRLFCIYEEYIWKNNNSKLDVLIQDKAISFYMYQDNEVIDEIILSFEEKERLMYMYICIRLLIVLLGNVVIYNKDNEFYNNTHKPYLKLIVNDEDIADSFKKIISMQEDTIINENMDIVLDIRDSLIRKKYSLDFIELVNNRIEFSRKLLRRVSK